MDFSEQAVERLDTTRPDDVLELLSRLCGQDVNLGCLMPRNPQRCGGCLNCNNHSMLSTLCRENRWNISTLNQALLLASQPTVSPSFYGQFFRTGEGGEDLKRGVVRFRGMAMLRFGNFRFAYKNLCSKGGRELVSELEPYSILPEQWTKYYAERPKTFRLVQDIDQNNKWYLGYISGTLAEEDFITLTALRVMLGGSEEAARAVLKTEDRWRKLKQRVEQLKADAPQLSEEQLLQLFDRVEQIQKDIEASRAIGTRNTSAYLSSDYLDVYVATSMRESWEYEDTSRFLEKVRAHDEVAGLDPVHFDPTLSYCKNRIDKGLIEGLMLKRARCTIYMVQETDTLGKDSELASTLAQGKPVIAYVPQESAEQVRKRLAAVTSLHFVTKRLLLLLAELRDLPKENRVEMSDFLLRAAPFAPLFRLVGTEQQEFLQEYANEWRRVKELLATAESMYFDKRAVTLGTQHPLALQVHLETGVANGVLVVRSSEQCARLLAQLLTNRCAFSIEREEGVYVLRENISQCPFRVVTDDPMLTNSFWDFYGRSSSLEALPPA